MDTNVITLLIFEFLGFIIFQFLFFRFLNKKKVMLWIALDVVAVYLLVLLFKLFSLVYVSGISYREIIYSFILFGVLAQIYILGIFGIVESSIRVRVLMEVYKSKNGLSKHDLFRKYNKDFILNKRLERFVSSGELKYDKSYYIMGNSFALSKVAALIFNYYWKLYS